ncbi:MAG: hypothetical protein IJJ31_04990 [Mogibacterium sp.]|nr:hypothetical protein [Mogibacterium sp.]
MLVLLFTLIVTWIVRNWWKLLLLLIGVIVLHEYQVRKYSKGNDKENADSEPADVNEAGPVAAAEHESGKPEEQPEAESTAEAADDTEEMIEEDLLT